jgi:hypothetical protein
MLSNHPKKLFCFLLLLFFIPILGAWYLFTYHNNWVHGTTNHGKLIQPMLRLDDLPLSDYNITNSINVKQWHNHWMMIYFKENNCDERCLTNIYLMGQTHTALGKFQDQVITAYVAIDPNEESNPGPEILRQYAHTLLLKTNTLDLNNFFNNNPAHVDFKQGQLFLVDPNGFVMMYYPTTVNFEDVYQDLNHLLKLGADA